MSGLELVDILQRKSKKEMKTVFTESGWKEPASQSLTLIYDFENLSKDGKVTVVTDSNENVWLKAGDAPAPIGIDIKKRIVFIYNKKDGIWGEEKTVK